MKQITILKFLINSNIGSRRFCFNLIKEGEIRVNNEIITQPLFELNLEDKVYYDCRIIDFKKELFKPVYILMNKPIKYLCSLKDEKDKPSIMRLIHHKDLSKKHLFPVGRLDYLTEGLLFITNDGDFTNYILRARNKVSKTYYVEIKGKISNEHLKRIQKGIYTKEESYKVEDVKLISTSKNTSKVKIVLIAGKNREIRNIFSILKYKIKNLKRTRIGPFQLDNKLRPGEYKLISKKKIDDFIKIR